MKKIKYILLIILCLVFLPACNKKENRELSSPLIFEVSTENSANKIYLLGSIHAADETVYPLPNKIMDAYKNSDILAVEFDLVDYIKDIGTQISVMGKFVYSDDETIKSYVSTETYDKMVKILTDAHLYTTLYDIYTPTIWTSLIENASIIKSGLNEEYGIDMYFLKEAKKDKKDILELESAELQYNILLNLSDEINLRLLEDSVNHFDDSVEELKNLYAAYKRGSKDELEKIIFTDEDDEQLEEYNDALITKRNIGMFDKLIEEYNNEKTIFCTVGLAHIIGPDGLVNLFENSGFTVTIR